ncbi:MAG: hypothetical protein GXO89_12490 [Chlorobi bacterium]|nr:hypothetical protein [Chlorobiota bacterium]
MKKAILIFLFYMIAQLIVVGQENYDTWVDGYIIAKVDNTKFEKDTVFGEIRFIENKMGLEFYKIELQMQSNETIKIQASEIISFQRGTKYYKSGFFDNNYSFAERIIHGPISLYSNTQSKYGNNICSNSNDGPKWNGTINQYGDDVDFYIEDRTSKKMTVIPSRYKKFVEVMEMYISDDKELMSLIVSKELKLKNIVEIINQYNANFIRKER